MSYHVLTPGFAISAQRLANWLVEAVSKAYAMSNRPAPTLTTHSTRGMATSVAALAGVDWEVIRKTLAWQGDLTFRKHYYHHLKVRTVADAVFAPSHTLTMSAG